MIEHFFFERIQFATEMLFLGRLCGPTRAKIIVIAAKRAAQFGVYPFTDHIEFARASLAIGSTPRVVFHYTTAREALCWILDDAEPSADLEHEAEAIHAMAGFDGLAHHLVSLGYVSARREVNADQLRRTKGALCGGADGLPVGLPPGER